MEQLGECLPSSFHHVLPILAPWMGILALAVSPGLTQKVLCLQDDSRYFLRTRAPHPSPLQLSYLGP